MEAPAAKRTKTGLGLLNAIMNPTAESMGKIKEETHVPRKTTGLTCLGIVMKSPFIGMSAMGRKSASYDVAVLSCDKRGMFEGFEGQTLDIPHIPTTAEKKEYFKKHGQELGLTDAKEVEVPDMGNFTVNAGDIIHFSCYENPNPPPEAGDVVVLNGVSWGNYRPQKSSDMCPKDCPRMILSCKEIMRKTGADLKEILCAPGSDTLCAWREPKLPDPYDESAITVIDGEPQYNLWHENINMFAYRSHTPSPVLVPLLCGMLHVQLAREVQENAPMDTLLIDEEFAGIVMTIPTLLERENKENNSLTEMVVGSFDNPLQIAVLKKDRSEVGLIQTAIYKRALLCLGITVPSVWSAVGPTFMMGFMGTFVSLSTPDTDRIPHNMAPQDPDMPPNTWVMKCFGNVIPDWPLLLHYCGLRVTKEYIRSRLKSSRLRFQAGDDKNPLVRAWEINPGKLGRVVNICEINGGDFDEDFVADEWEFWVIPITSIQHSTAKNLAELDHVGLNTGTSTGETPIEDAVAAITKLVADRGMLTRWGDERCQYYAMRIKEEN